VLIKCKDGDIRTFVKQVTPKDLHQIMKARGVKADFWEVKNTKEKLANEVVSWERLGVQNTFKFGVMYCKSGQKTESEMLGNEHGSPEFENFLDLLGVRVILKDWRKFNGGLSVAGQDLDGIVSVYTQFHAYEIMFHVSTLLHYRADDPQQIDRKRHIGNDIVVLVFMEEGGTFTPGFMRTQFNHIYFVVQPFRTENGTLKYRLAIAAKEGVPPFGPMLPNIPDFDIGSSFKEYLLTKMVNAERAALNAPSFGDIIAKHKQTFLSSLTQKFNEKQ